MVYYSLLIRDYLVKEKSVSLEKIGSLIIGGKNLSSESPAQPVSFQFQYDKNAVNSPKLINYIAENTGKNRELIQSDLESYMESVRQLINIGKPYQIEGIGEFRLVKSNEYKFTAYNSYSGKQEQKISNKYYKSSSTANKKKPEKSILMMVALLIILGVLGVLGWGTYNFFTTSDIKKTIIDTAISLNTSPVKDTIKKRSDTLLRDTMSSVKNDTNNYKFVFETTSSAERAYKRTAQLKKYGEPADYDSLFTDTAITYQLYLKMRLIPADTALAKDSIQKYLQRSVNILPMN